jgi:hypothetical protein
VHDDVVSAIASATLLPKSVVSALAQATALPSFELLAQQGHSIGSYEHSGYVLATLLPYLEESRGVALMSSEFDAVARSLSQQYGATCFVFTDAHREWLPKLDPETFSEQDLRDYFNAFNETSDSDAGVPMLDGVWFLREVVAALEPTTVGLLMIG